MLQYRTILSFFVLFFLLISLGSCTLPITPANREERESKETNNLAPGAALAQYGNYIYVVGGSNPGDVETSSVNMVRASSAVAVQSNWSTQLALPEYRVDAVVFTLGNKLYVLGGYDAAGIPQTDIYYTFIRSSDGRLGYGTPGKWMRNPRSLPWGNAEAAWIIHDGTIYLLGGNTTDGETDSIIRAKFYADGQIGYWYLSDFRLTSPRRGSTAEIWHHAGDPIVVIAGGVANGRKLDIIDGIVIGNDGSFSSAIPTIGRLPVASASPILVPDRDELFLGTNTDSDNQIHAWYKSNNFNDWTLIDIYDSGLAGSSRARSEDGVVYLRSSLGSDISLATQKIDISPAPPVVHPGSGILSRNTPIRIISTPGSTVYYRVGAPEDQITSVDRSDSVWNRDNVVTSDATYAFRAYTPDGKSSSVVSRRYRVDSRGLFVHVDSLAIQETNSQKNIVVSSGWYRLESDGGSVALSVTPTTPDGQASDNYRPLISLFEQDLHTPVTDHRGTAILNLEMSSSDPLILSIPQGTFFLNISSATDGPGESDSFGISIYKYKEETGDL